MPPSPTGPTLAALPPKTIADALDRLERDASLAASRRREFIGAMRSICNILRRPPEAVPASLAEIQVLLNEVPVVAQRRSRKTIANLKSRIKASLAHFSGRTLIVPRGSPLTAEWAALRDRLPDRRYLNGLSRLMRYASHAGVAPDAMSDAFLDRVVDAFAATNGPGAARRYRRITVKLWNEVVAKIEGWPQIELAVRAVRAHPPHLPLTAFPATFTRELDDYLAWLSGADRFAANGPPSVIRPSTLRRYRELFRLCASALAETTGGPSRIVSLAVLVEPEHAKTILTFYIDRAGGKPTAFVRGMAMALLSLARHWLKLDAQHLEPLAEFRRRLGSTPSGLTPKNRKVLRQLSDPQLRSAILHLPSTLADHARRQRSYMPRRVQRMQIAVAIEILLVAPMRMQNLSTLRLDRQLSWPNGREGSLFLVLGEDETKNSQPLEYELPPQSKALVCEYLDRFRTLLTPEKSPWLFVRSGGIALGAAALRDGITKAIFREIGIHMTPHQFRHLAAQITLDAYPGAYPLVKELLGHRDLKTTAGFYAGMRTKEAGRVYAELLERGLEGLKKREPV